MMISDKPAPRPKRAKSGDIVRVPVDETQWSYGRVTNDRTIAIYDIITKHEMSVEQILRSPVLFRVPMMRFAFNGREWPLIGNQPLEEELQQPAEFLAMRIWQNVKRKIYGVILLSAEYEVSYERAKGLELMAIYEPTDVAQRLALHAEGKVDPMVELGRIEEDRQPVSVKN